MIEIIPAIIPHSLKEIKERISLVRGLVKIVQIDVMDGFFVPEKSWPYAGEEDEVWRRLVSGKEGLPYWQEIDYEIDLMVAEPLETVGKWYDAGAARVIVHFESTGNLRKITHEYGKSKMHELGLAVAIETRNSAIEALLSQFDFIQYMGIEKIGYQGEPFSERVIPKIQDLRKRYPDVIISVDGGVNFENAPRLIEAGANRLVSGSAIWNSSNVEEAIKMLAGAA